MIQNAGVDLSKSQSGAGDFGRLWPNLSAQRSIELHRLGVPSWSMRLEISSPFKRICAWLIDKLQVSLRRLEEHTAGERPDGHVRGIHAGVHEAVKDGGDQAPDLQGRGPLVSTVLHTIYP